MTRRISGLYVAFLFVSFATPALPSGDTENDEGQEGAYQPWQPPFVGGVTGPLFGVGHNGFLELDAAAYADDSSGQFRDDVIVRRARFTFGRDIGHQWAVKGSAEELRRRLLDQATGRLVPGGFVALEVGAGQAGRARDDLMARGFRRVVIRNDLAGIGRVVAGTWAP